MPASSTAHWAFDSVSSFFPQPWVDDSPLDPVWEPSEDDLAMIAAHRLRDQEMHAEKQRRRMESEGAMQPLAATAVNIAGFVTLTGAFSAIGMQYQTAWTWWAQKINAKGGILIMGQRRPVNLQLFDVTSTAATQVNITTRVLINRDYDYFPIALSPYSSGFAISTSAICEVSHTICLSVGATYDQAQQCPFPIGTATDCANKPPNARRFQW
jgi:ABC-type branched-subunit amino acid transport system substrate-binding protein